MSSLPNRRLDELIAAGEISLGRGDVISKDDISNHPGPFPIYSSSAQNNGLFGTYGKFMFDEELISWSVDGGGYFFYRKKHKYSVTNVCGYMRIKPDRWHPKFVFYSLHNQHRFLTFDYTSKAHPSVIKKQYRLPDLDLALQQKIASILSTIDTAIEQTEALIAKYQNIKAGLMHDLFTRGVLPNGQLRPPRDQAPELYQETAIGWIPKEWRLPRLADMSNTVSGVTLGAKPTLADTIEAPYLRVANVQDGFLDLRDVKSVRISAKTLEQLRLQAGDVLMNEGGDFDKLGRGAVWNGEIENCVHQNHVFRVRCNLAVLLPNYLAFYSESVNGKKYFVMNSKQSTNLASINSSQLKAFPIALPGMNEQSEITRRIQSAKFRLDALKREAEKLQTQKLGLMQDLLTGRVSVTPSPAQGVATP